MNISTLKRPFVRSRKRFRPGLDSETALQERTLLTGSITMLANLNGTNGEADNGVRYRTTWSGTVLRVVRVKGSGGTLDNRLQTCCLISGQ
jgi:hypothetical protein